MTAEDRTKALTALTDAARRDGAEMHSILEARVRQFEMRYTLTSTEMLRALTDGRLSETPDIAEWLFLLNALSSDGEHETRP